MAELRGPAPDVALRPLPRRHPLPLSYAQYRLWFLDRLAPGDPTFNMPAPLRLRGGLKPAVMRACLDEIVRRHEVLRTTFRVADGEPYQHVAPDLAVELPETDLTVLEPADREAEVVRWQRWDRRTSFDLARGPLFRLRLLRLDRDEHVLLLNLHHTVCDGWSLGVLVREMTVFYTAGRRLPELPIQYADYALWQQDRLAGNVGTAQLAWWRRRLSGAPPVLDLPADRPRPAVQSHRGAQLSHRLDAELSERLRRFSRQRDVTLFMTLLAGFNVVVARLSGQHDVLVGTPIAGRERGETEDLIGCFLNTLVLRTDLSGDPTFEELLSRVREVAVGAYAHQEVPFEKLLEELAPERDLSRTPLFQVFFNMLNVPLPEGEVAGLRIESLDLPEVDAKFDLTVYVVDDPGGLRWNLVYSTELFDRDRMETFSAQLELVLRQAVERPQAPIGEYSLLTQEARRRLPDPTAALSDAWPGAVHEIFDRRAAATPEAPAVIDREGVVTYRGLAALAAWLAAELATGDVGRGAVVAIRAQRSAALVWSLLGVMKSGAAFVILDPSYPPARQAEILRQAAPGALVVLPAGDDGPPAAVRETVSRVLTLPERTAWPAIIERATSAPAVALGPDDVAYLAFTSGSTGVPKGILGAHRSLTHFLPWQCERFGFTAADRFSMLSGLPHDPLHRDLFTPLQTGAAVVVPDPERMSEPGYLAAWMAREGITVANLTPAMGQLLTLPAPGTAARIPSLRLAFFVGDVLTRRDVLRLRLLAPEVEVVSYYGTTETQQALAHHVVPPAPVGVLPLGRGIPDVQLLVLTPAGRSAGIGELGEIAFRSPHLARGYLDPDLTQERFTGSGADRIYRTGDLGRYLPNGDVVFAGRADQQLKIRGFRIELGEIEAVLREHPAVAECAVVARGEVMDRQLVACVVLASDGSDVTFQLRSHLRERLPGYMVPAAFALLDELPLTPTGKLDRAALGRLVTAPDVAEDAEDVLAPRTPTEETLAAICRELLGVRLLGVEDDFFNLGGHSLLAVRLLARVRAAFGVELPVRDLFQAPTVAGLAVRIDAARRPAGAPAAWSPLVEIRGASGVPSRPPLFCIHPAGGTVLCYAALARHLDLPAPFYGLQALGLAAGQEPLTTIEEQARCYLDAIREVRPAGPYHLGGWSMGGLVAYEIARQLRAAGEEVGVLALLDAGPIPSRTQDELSLFSADSPLLPELDLPSEGLAEWQELEAEEQVVRVWHRLRELELVPQDVELPRDVEPVDLRILGLFLANIRAFWSYRPDPYAGPVTLFVPEDGRPSRKHTPADRRWSAVGVEVERVTVPGNHLTLIAEPHVRVLAERLRPLLVK